MGYILPQLAQPGATHDPTRPLSRRIERVARMVADHSLTIAEIARRADISPRTVDRLKTRPTFMARVAHLRRVAADAALNDEPLALKGNRVSVAGRMVRTLNQQLEENGYEATLGVSKHGNPITGFDRARVSEIRQYLSYIEGAMEPKQSTIVESTHVGVSVTIDDAVTRVQALLSRTQPPPAEQPEE
jgi:orotate phosphoribosyltransferase-like protein